MSSAKHATSHRSLTGLRLAGLLVVGTAALLAGCADGSSGFRPLHASTAVGGSGAQDKLATLDIAPIPGRVGQRIRNELIFQSTGGGAAQPPEYRLDIAIRESVSSTLVQIDGNARGQVYNLDASFKLVRLSDKKIVAEGKSYSRAGFERVRATFSNVRAREEAENRAAKVVGEELRTRLLAVLSRPA